MAIFKVLWNFKETIRNIMRIYESQKRQQSQNNALRHNDNNSNHDCWISTNTNMIKVKVNIITKFK